MNQQYESGRLWPKTLISFVYCALSLCACTEFVDVFPVEMDSEPPVEQDDSDINTDLFADTDSQSGVTDTSLEFLGLCTGSLIDPEPRDHCTEYFGTGWGPSTPEDECSCEPTGDVYCEWHTSGSCGISGCSGICTCEHADDKHEVIHYYDITNDDAQYRCLNTNGPDPCVWHGSLNELFGSCHSKNGWCTEFYGTSYIDDEGSTGYQESKCGADGYVWTDDGCLTAGQVGRCICEAGTPKSKSIYYYQPQYSAASADSDCTAQVECSFEP